jgi:hypothetical protein
MAMQTTTTVDTHDRPRTRGLVLDDLGFLVLVCLFMGWSFGGVWEVEYEFLVFLLY